MSQVKIFRWTDENKQTAPRKLASNAMELFDQTGLWSVIKIFSYFGFRLQENPQSHRCLNRCHVGIILSFGLLAYGAAWFFMIPLILNDNGNIDLENAGFFSLMVGGYFTIIANFCLGINNAKKYSTLFRSLASAVDQINDPDRRRRVVRSIKRTSFLWSVPCLAFTIQMGFSVLNQGQYWMNAEGKTAVDDTYILVNIINSVSTLWMLIIGQFYAFNHIFLTITCKIISILIEIYLRPEMNLQPVVSDIWNDPKQQEEIQEDEIKKKITNHQKLSSIVTQANSVFSHFLLLTLTIEILVCIALVKLLTIKNGAYSYMVLTYALNTSMMVWKAFISGNINEKLKSSLTMKKLPNFNCFSNARWEQVNYILYLEEQNITKAELSYGNIFPVTRTFIFTIAGTILTYALVLQGV